MPNVDFFRTRETFCVALLDLLQALEPVRGGDFLSDRQAGNLEQWASAAEMIGYARAKPIIDFVRYYVDERAIESGEIEQLITLCHRELEWLLGRDGIEIAYHAHIAPEDHRSEFLKHFVSLADFESFPHYKELRQFSEQGTRDKALLIFHLLEKGYGCDVHWIARCAAYAYRSAPK